MKPARSSVLIACLALAWGCSRKEAAPPPPSARAAAPEPAETVPWTWHPLGDLAVIEGEVPESTNLVLEGPSVRLTRFAEAGPVRWELYRPPEGEVAILRTSSGHQLARFDFSTRSHPGRQAAPAPSARAAEPPAPPKPPPARKPAPPPPPKPARIPPPRPRPVPAEPPQARIPRPAPAPRPVPPPVPAPPPPTTFARPPRLPARAKPLPPRASAPTWSPGTKPAPARPAFEWPKLQPPPEAGPGPTWPGMGEALNLTRGPRNQKAIVLSFDGGSSDEVATEVLDTLKARGVHTTIFLTGQFIRRFPALVRRMVADGHEIGNHTMDHPHFAPGMRRDPAWTKARVQKELLDADAEFLRVTGRPMAPLWRAPYGEQTPEIRRWAEEIGYRTVGWSEGADTLDWATTKTRRLYHTGPAILARLQKRLAHDGDGLIVLMHLGSDRPEPDRPAIGLGAFMDRARAEGWSFVNVGTFLREMGKPAWDPRHRLALLEPGASLRGAGSR